MAALRPVRSEWKSQTYTQYLVLTGDIWGVIDSDQGMDKQLLSIFK